MTSPKKNLILAFVAAISLVIILSIASFTRINAFVESAAEVNQTTQVTLELEKTRGSLRAAETAKRGYLLTHDKLFLDNFEKSLKEYPQHIAIVRDLTSDNSEQLKSLETVELLAQKRDDYFRKLLEVDKSRPVAPEEYLRGETIMDSLVAEILTMEIRENTLLDQRSSELLKQSLYAPIILLFTGFIALSVLIFSYLKLNRSLIQEHKIRAEGIQQAYELEISNERLKNENKFRDMVEQAPVAICLLRGKDFVVEIANAKQLQNWDRTKEDMLNRPIFKDVPQEQVQFLIDMLNGVLTTGEPYIATEMASVQVKDGIERMVYVNFICEPFYNDGEIDGIMAVSTDVTEQVLDRKRVEESESKFKSLIEAAPIGIGVFRGRELIIENPNKEMIDIMGKGPDIIGKRLIDVMPELHETGQQYLKILDDIFTTGKMYQAFGAPVTIERGGVLKAGFFDINYVPLFNSKNEVYAILDIATDVTERVESTKKIQESEQRFQAAVEAVQGVLWTNTPTGEMEGEQIGWSFLTGQTYEEYQGYGWADSVHPDDRVPTIEAWNLAVENRSIFIFEHRLKTKEGKYRDFSVRAIPLINQDGSLLQWVGVHTDITLQKQQQVKLEESESRYRSLADNIPMISFIVEPDPQATVSYWNKTWLDFTGQTFEEALGRAWNNFIHPEDVPEVLEIYGTALEKREPYHMPGVRVKRHDGEYRWHLFNGNPRYLSNGEFMGFIGVGFDIHDKKLAEEKLAYRTALLEAHNQASVDGILLVDAKGKIISHNQRFTEIWNMPKFILDAKDDDAALSFGMDQLLHPQQFIDRVRQLYMHHSETTLDYLELKDGRIIERNGYPVIGNDGNYYAWSWTFRDVTRQKQIEKEIRESEERFRTLAQTLPQLVWVADAHGKQEFASLKWEEYSGVEPNGEEEWKAIVHPEDYDRINAKWAHSLATGNFYKSEVRLRNKHGEYRWHAVNGEPVFDDENNITKWVGAFTDIHEQKLNDERKDEFLSIASHEMKTPLTTAKAYLQMLELSMEECDDEESYLYTKKANQSVDRLTELVGELLDVSKIRLGKLQYNLAVFNFNEMIADTVESIQLTTSTHKIIQSGRVNEQVIGDKDRLQQVVINLLTNAIKYSPGAEEVLITVDQQYDSIKVSVQDFGIGIAQTSLDKIFDKYHRVEEHAIHFQGLGIGLFISYEIIQRHNGKLWAKSETGKGSTFYFTIPNK